jgi:hypothetical protein
MCLRSRSRASLFITAILGGFVIINSGRSGVVETPPGIAVQTLPGSQQRWRIKQLRAIRDEIDGAASSAKHAYEDTVSFPEFEEILRIDRGRNFFGSNETVAFLSYDDQNKIIKISIRGTSNFNDVLIDLNAAASPSKKLGFPVHAGFDFIASQLYDRLENHPAFQNRKGYKLRFSGHSLGGATATLLAMMFHENGREVDMVVTFGAPRFVTNEGARKYQVLNERTFRVVRCDDVVPFLPPPNFFGWSTESYEASGDILLLLKWPNFDYSRGVDIERDFVDQLRREFDSVAGRARLAVGHRMDNYWNLVTEFGPRGLMMRLPDYLKKESDQITDEDADVLKPVHYQMSRKSELCPFSL